MFSALKKLTTSVRPEAPSAGAQPGSVPMSDSLQKKFARGVQYNSKSNIIGIWIWLLHISEVISSHLSLVYRYKN